MLPVFLGLFVFLLFLIAASVQSGRHSGILKKLPVAVIAVAALVIPSRAPAQTTPNQSSPAAPLPDKPPETAAPSAPTPETAAPSAPTPETAAPSAPTPETAAPSATSPVTAAPAQLPETAAPASSPETASERPISWKLLFHNWVEDQKHIWTFPVRLAQGQDLIPTAAVLGATAGLFYADPIESRYFRRTTTFNEFRNIFNGNAMSIGMGATAASMYAIGRFRKDSKMQKTALFVGEAMADAAMVQTVLKDVTMRRRPISYPASGWFATGSSPTSYIRGNGSFPSGHSMEAFSVATIIARRYGNHRWVPYVAYGLASLVGFSRLTLNVHFVSDVFMGGALGYSISRFTVLRQ
jgi:membrane-associated phospholipid phosphatase